MVPSGLTEVTALASMSISVNSTEQHRRVLLFLEHLTGSRRDLAFGQHAGRDLVEKRLEQVV